MTYALLLLLHEREVSHRASGGDCSGGCADADAESEVCAGGGDSESVWRKDPLQLLPTVVANEAKHVAGMLRGLMEMCGCEKCTMS